MAKHEITVYQNTGATKETAPYIGSYISKETLRLDGFKAKISERCGLPAIQVQAILAGAFDAIEALEKESLVRVHLDGFTVCGIITGSFPTADAAFNKDKNALQMAVRLDEPIRNELAAIVPAIVTDSSVTRLRVDNVMDLETPRPYNVIHGKHVFRVAGFNMVLTDEGAGAKLVDSRGIEYELVIDEVVSKQLFKAHTAELLEPGDYKLVVKSKAGDAEGPLQTAFRRVKYLEVVDPPTVDSIATEGKEGIVKGAEFAATGSHLSWKAGDKVTVKWTEDGEEKSLEVTPTETTPTKMDFAAVEAFDDIPDDTELTFEFELSGASVEGETRILGE